MSEQRSRAFLYGESVFTTLRVENGKAFFAEAHRERLLQSAEWLWPGSRSQAEALWPGAFQQFPQGNGVWRLTFHVLGERGAWRPRQPKLQLDSWWNEGLPSVQPLKLQTCVVPARASLWPSFVKSSDYLPRMIAAREMSNEPLFVVNNTITETMFANIVFLREKTFVTPMANADVLAGIGRARLQSLAAKHGFKWEERTVNVAELTQMTTAYAVNAVRGLIPIESIDGKATSAHPIQQIMSEFFHSDEIH